MKTSLEREPLKRGHEGTLTQVYNIDEVLEDGWVVGPVSKNTGLVMSVEPAETSLEDPRVWRTGMEHAERLRNEGHRNARTPNLDELKLIWQKFVENGHNDNAQFITDGIITDHWSSTMCEGYGYGQRPEKRYANLGYRPTVVFTVDFCDGRDDHTREYKQILKHVRCVRDETDIVLAPS